MRKIGFLIAGASALSLSACTQPGADLQANVYQAGQVNQAQVANVVDILAVLPAKVEVTDNQQRAVAQIGGAVIGTALGAVLGNAIGNAGIGGAVAGGAVGAVAGTATSNKVLVNGVSITYTSHNQTLNSAEVGQLCQFKPGRAIMVSTGPTSTRIQPNATCPPPAKQ